jgi:SNF2-related domain/Helicase conserved C-terminal domain
MNVSVQPLPARVTYQFPPEAFQVQKWTTALFIENPRGYCINELGTGKTRSILFAFDALKQAGMVQRMIVLCPLSAMRRTWYREVLLYFPHLKATILHGTKEARGRKLFEKVDIYIINHDGLEVLQESLMQRDDIDCVCVDEIGGYRNGRAEKTKLLRQYVMLKDYVWGMTGSPIPRAVTDVWGPCSCLTPHTVPKFFTIFRDQLMFKKGPFRWLPKPNAEERAVACMQPSVRFKLSDVTELPERVIKYYQADLTPKQSYVYEAMRKQAVALVGAHKIDALNAGAVLSKLMQIAIGYVYTRDGKTIHMDNTPRLQLILDLIDSTQRKVLLFAPFKSAVAAFSAFLTTNKIDHAVVTGGTTLKNRDQIFADFQDTGKYKVITAHPGCMSHSLTLTKANTTIWAGPVTSLETFQQANGRTYRVGQDDKTLVAMVGGTPMEERMYKLLAANEKLQNRFLEIVEAITEEGIAQ